ncbi:hypothetical protein [Brevibacillus dissolubilis]|uniref:hypothetical protein n=1 Tax=Brevibacillus dissolubilis TaxID=1844116 RepID=UPI0011160637|nr:hypothetical protein [Brevibacillus dissolubilis]
MSFSQAIHDYGMSVDDFETSPFEALDMLHIRSRLQRNVAALSHEEKQLLQKYDLILLANAKKMAQHLTEVYEFTSNRPLEEWWWHLDQVAEGNIQPFIKNDLSERNLAL